MKKIIDLLIIIFLVNLPVLTNAQSGWKKNKAGHDVFVYKPEPIPVYKPPVMGITTRKKREDDDKKINENNPAERLNGVHKSIYVAQGIYYGYYEGNWNNNIREGAGKFSFDYGNVYEGDWKSNQMDGYGIYTYKTGGVYTGTFKKGKINGQGTFKFTNGDSYTGSWVDDKRQGYGVYKIYNTGAVYEGGFINNEFYGQGKLTEKDSTGWMGFFTGDNTNIFSLEYFKPKSMNLVGEQVKNFVLTTSENKNLSFASFKGKYVLITFWDVNRNFDDVHREVPNALKLYKQKGFAAFSIGKYELGGSINWQSEIDYYKPKWPQAYARSYDDTLRSYYERFGLHYSNILVNPKGKIIGQNLFDILLTDALEKIFKK